MIQVYTGGGKGKTTAALGLALRASGAGLKVFIGQFAKGRACSELKSLKKIKNIKCQQFGGSCFIQSPPTKHDLKLAQDGWKKIKKIIREGTYDLVILDEVGIALNFNLLSLKEFCLFIKDVPKSLELVLTGRDMPGQVLEIADLVSEIKEKKHYYRQGIKARQGIEY